MHGATASPCSKKRKHTVATTLLLYRYKKCFRRAKAAASIGLLKKTLYYTRDKLLRFCSRGLSFSVSLKVVRGIG